MRLVPLAALVFAVTSMLSACGVARELEQSSTAEGCTRCHGLPPAQGAHEAHLAGGAFSNGVACGSCHVVPTSAAHSNGQVDIQFSALAQQDVANPGYAGNGGTCAVYCHGSTPVLGNRTSPAWTSTAGIACGACHSLTPTSGFHDFHLNRATPVACTKCHSGYSATSVVKATHVDGASEASIEPTATTSAATFSSWPVSCTTCHTGGIPL